MQCQVVCYTLQEGLSAWLAQGMVGQRPSKEHAYQLGEVRLYAYYASNGQQIAHAVMAVGELVDFNVAVASGGVAGYTLLACDKRHTVCMMPAVNKHAKTCWALQYVAVLLPVPV